MPRREDIHKVIIIGSGPIIIGQACEFDYSGTQACKALKAEGYEIVLVRGGMVVGMMHRKVGNPVAPFLERPRQRKEVPLGAAFFKEELIDLEYIHGVKEISPGDGT